MHDTDSFARMPALDLAAEQTRLEELLSIFEEQREVAFKEEIYLVRDNGSVCRRARLQARKRKLDEVWTFGTLNRHSGYFEIAGHVVHRIVATAFHGPEPSSEYVVDHIDTNRLNNRPDNLRWVTRLENILLNPITRTRIELAYGSLEAFFANPGASTIPNWEWMRVVTKEQAEESRKRLLEWAETGRNGNGGTLGLWVYEPRIAEAGENLTTSDAVQLMAAQREALEVPAFDFPVADRDVRIPGAVSRTPVIEPVPLDTVSLTASAFQRKWRTPTEFPHCPATVADGALLEYLARLVPGTVFTRSRYGENIVVVAAICPDNNILNVVCSMPPGSVKGWSHAKVYVEDDQFCHESDGTYFTHEGAMKAHCLAIGAPTDAYEESIDDYC